MPVCIGESSVKDEGIVDHVVWPIHKPNHI